MMRILLALFSALLLILSFPTFDIHFLAWFSLVPLFLAIRNQSLKSTLGLFFLFSLSFLMAVFYWINIVKDIKLYHYFIFGVYLSLYFLLFGFFLHIISKRAKLPLIVTAPPLWIGMEYLRSHAGFMSFPWALLGHSQHSNLPMIQMASFTGAYGISFLIMLANAAIADVIVCWIERRERREPFVLISAPFLRGIVVIVMILILWVAGYIYLSPTPSGKSLSVSVVQGNIPQEMKWKREYREQIIAKYEKLSEEASTSKPRLIVWPEASTPGFVLNDLTLLKRMVSMVRRLEAFFLIGSTEYPKFTKVKPIKSGNTALFFSPEGKILGQYLKIRLLPFGEYVPYEGVFPWPDFIVPKGMNANLAGTELVLFGIDGTKFGILICSEAMYPGFSRRMVREGAGFLVNINNEAWFGKSAYPYQSNSLCVFRAIENRVNIIKASNTGISCFIDPYGRVTDRVMNGDEDIFVAGTSTRNIFLPPPGTFYTHYGDVFAFGCIAFSIGLIIWGFLRGGHLRDRHPL